ncbi:hypothetical protein U1Q18_020842 [Sarracenia purpurea var. burkii]
MGDPGRVLGPPLIIEHRIPFSQAAHSCIVKLSPLLNKRRPYAKQRKYSMGQASFSDGSQSRLQNFGGSIGKEVSKDEPEGKGLAQTLHTGSRPTGSMSSAEQSVQIDEADPTPSGRSSSEEPKP